LPGTAVLASRAALRAGCGTVRVAAPASVAMHIGLALPELMVLPLPETAAGTLASSALALIEEQYEPCDAAIIGPGLDEDDETAELSRQIIVSTPLPLLIDAQALTSLNKPKSADYGTAAAARVITPHPAEMSALLGREVSEIESSREITAHDFARKRGMTLVLKGRETLIGGPDGKLYQNTAGTRGLGTAGSGDVLAGIIGGLLAQKMDATQAAVWGVHMHALCGESAAKDLGDDGLMAYDLIERLPNVQRYLRRLTSPRRDENPAGLRRTG
jgi:NAD(P)H-hydrate epimerase